VRKATQPPDLPAMRPNSRLRGTSAQSESQALQISGLKKADAKLAAIAASIRHVNVTQVSGRTGAAAAEVLDASNELWKQGLQLKDPVHEFLRTVRAA
jgi:uncharacterized protein YdcH (DUF465 family)